MIPSDFRPCARTMHCDLPIESPRPAPASLLADFVALPSNLSAVEAASAFVSGKQRYCSISGPSGWGKSHLLHNCVEMLIAKGETSVHMCPAISMVATAPLREQPRFLMLDDAQTCLLTVKDRQRLRVLLESRARLNKPTFIAFSVDEIAKSRVLPTGGQWTLGRINAPHAPERQAILSTICQKENLQMDDTLLRALSAKLTGNGHTLLGAIRRVKLIQDQWCAHKDGLKLFGTLQPFLYDATGYDIRDALYDRTRELALRGSPGLSDTEIEDLVLYVMATQAELTERTIADYFSTTPGKIHVRINRAIEKSQGALRDLYANCVAELDANIDLL